jgi:hypothetical protein
MKSTRCGMRDAKLGMRDAGSGMRDIAAIAHRPFHVVLLLGAALVAASGNAAEVGAAADVAPQVENSRQQGQPSAAWSEGAKCWLVVWREGCPNELENDVLCARMSADGKALDPKGIPVGKAKDVQESPRVSSDGKDFLVVWQDLRNGQDYDVYGARVSGDGKVLDPDGGFVVAGGPHNQCFPDVTFSKDQYCVAWQAMTGNGDPGTPGTGYHISGASVTREGKVGPAAEIGAAGDRQTFWPSVAGGADGAIVVGQSRMYDTLYFGYGVVAGPAAGPLPVICGQPLARDEGHRLGLYGTTLAMVRAGDRFLIARAVKSTSAHEIGAHVWPLDKLGKPVGEVPIDYSTAVCSKKPGGMGRISLACDGERVLFTMDEGGRTIQGAWLGLDGKPVGGKKDEFVVVTDPVKGEGDGFACAGAKGTFLVVNVETRGPDDYKIMARIVK